MDAACQLGTETGTTRRAAWGAGLDDGKISLELPEPCGALSKWYQEPDRHRRAACADLLATDRLGLESQFSIGSAVVDQPSLVMVTT